MTVRVRYVSNDLSEGVVEEIGEANGYIVEDDESVTLTQKYTDDEGQKFFRKVGYIRKDRYESVVVSDVDVDVDD